MKFFEISKSEDILSLFLLVYTYPFVFDGTVIEFTASISGRFLKGLEKFDAYLYKKSIP